VLWVFSWLAILPFPIKPNVYLVGIVFLAFVVSDVSIFLLAMLAILFWLKYTPVPSYELVVLGIIGVVYAFVRRAIIREPHPAAMAVGVVIGQLVFWMIFAQESVWSLLFAVELFYNLLVLLILYGIWGWVKKKFN